MKGDSYDLLLSSCAADAKADGWTWVLKYDSEEGSDEGIDPGTCAFGSNIDEDEPNADVSEDDRSSGLNGALKSEATSAGALKGETFEEFCQTGLIGDGSSGVGAAGLNGDGAAGSAEGAGLNGEGSEETCPIGLNGDGASGSAEGAGLNGDATSEAAEGAGLNGEASEVSATAGLKGDGSWAGAAAGLNGEGSEETCPIGLNGEALKSELLELIPVENMLGDIF